MSVNPWKVTSCLIYCTALDKSPVKCVKTHSGEEVRRRGTVGIQMEGRLGLIVREAKWLRCSCCALRAGGGLTCCWGWGQERVDSNGVTQHAHNSTLITPFTITVTYFPERAGPTIITATQMKWIIVSLCGTSGNGGERERVREDGDREAEEEERQMDQEV